MYYVTLLGSSLPLRRYSYLPDLTRNLLAPPFRCAENASRVLKKSNWEQIYLR